MTQVQKKRLIKITAFTSLLIGFGVAITTLITSITTSYNISKNLYSSFQEVEQTHQIIEGSHYVMLKLNECEGSVRGFLITSNTNFLNEYENSLDTIRKEINRLENLTTDNEAQQQHLKQLKELVNTRINVFNSSISTEKQQQADEALVISQVNEAQALMNQIRQLTKTIQVEEQQLLKEQQDTAYQSLRHTHYITILSGLVTLTIAILVSLIIYRNMQHRKKVEQELREIDDNKNRFFSIIGHDLRGPVNNCNALVQMLTDEVHKPSEEESQQIIKMLSTSVKRTSALLESLLTWGRIQMNRVECQPEQLDLRELTQSTLNVLQNTAVHKNINLINRITPQTSAYADKNMTSTVIRNLVSNAIKFTRTGGEIYISATPKDNYMELAITDNGVGIRPETLKELFAFNTKHSTKGTANEEGSGMGLALCKEFVKKNRGNIWAESEPMVGSTFKVQLPVK